MKTLLIILLTLCPMLACAGNTNGLIFVSQSATDNASQGKKHNFDIGFGLNIDEVYMIDTLEIRIKTKLAVGTSMQYHEKFDKTFFLPSDNVLTGDYSLKYKLGWTFDPFISFTFSTTPQISKRLVGDKIMETARFGDPVTFKENIGLGYAYRAVKDNFSTRLGFSFQQIRADSFVTLTDDRATQDIIERYKESTGITWKSDANLSLDSIFTYRGMLEGFTTFEDMETWDVKFNNQLEATIYKKLTLIFKFDMIYNRKQSLDLQFTQSFRIGAIYSTQ